MKKGTGIFLLIAFFFFVVVVLALFVTVVVLLMQDTTPNLLRSHRLALVRIEGVIYDAEEWIDQIKEYQEDSSIKGIVLRIDSPGGAVGPSQDLYQAVVDAQKKYKKIVVASFGSIAASGGYYVACNADKIVSTPGTLTGSIGVYAKFPVMKELFEKIGIGYQTVKAGEYKDAGSMEKGLTEKEEMMMQGVIDDTYDQFVEAVYQGRKKSLNDVMMNWDEDPPFEYPLTSDVVEIIQQFQRERDRQAIHRQTIQSETIAGATVAASTDTSPAPLPALKPEEETVQRLARSIAEGKIYTGRQAKSLGLVDELGTLEDAINLAAKLAGISGEPTVVERKKRQIGILDLLTESLVYLRQQLKQQSHHSMLEYKFPY